MKILMNDIQREARFHSFLICQSKSVEIAQKFPYHVVTLNNYIVNSDEKQKEKDPFQYNYTIDSVSVIINRKKLLLSQGDWLHQFLTKQQAVLLKNLEYISFKNLKVSQAITFFYYDTCKRQFFQILPTFLTIHDCLIFDNLQGILINNFKKISKAFPENKIRKFLYLKNKSQEKKQNIKIQHYYCYKCEYAFISDIHFLRSFVRGKRSMCSYIKKQEYFIFWIDPMLHKLIQKINLIPML